VTSVSPKSELSARELAAWRGMLEAHSRVISSLDAELERDHGIQLTAYEVLMHLGAAPGEKLRMGELAQRLLLSRSGITRLVDRLEGQGLVARRRCDDDGRGFNAVLTPAGREQLDACRADHLDGVRRHFTSKLEPGDMDALAAAWERLLGENGDGELSNAG
jgi:DNA-binding MarR family transcriptional regulator